VVLVMLATAGCDKDEAAPPSLLDASEAPTLPVALEGVDEPIVSTKVKIVRADGLRASSRSASCLSGPAHGARPIGTAVERVAVASETVTFRERSALVGCDNAPGPREDNRRWCGGAFGRLLGGRLSDPRVDLAGCRTEDGDPMAFAWVEPRRDARYLVVEEEKYAEVYEVTADLPVRVATASGLEAEPLGATFRLSEHDAGGHLLRRYHLVARPAG
jgi:hypothetical protein